MRRVKRGGLDERGAMRRVKRGGGDERGAMRRVNRGEGEKKILLLFRRRGSLHAMENFPSSIRERGRRERRRDREAKRKNLQRKIFISQERKKEGRESTLSLFIEERKTWQPISGHHVTYPFKNHKKLEIIIFKNSFIFI